MSDPDTKHIRHCLETCDFVVLQEIFPSETAPYADVLLPGVCFCRKDRHLHQHRAAHPDGAQGHRAAGRSARGLAIIADLAKRILAEGERQVDRADRMPAGITPIRPRSWPRSPP